MKQWRNLLFAILMLASMDAMADKSPSMTGHYYLSGMMETGSELLFRPDGRFQWFISYGAMDQYAEGTWKQLGSKIVLTTDPAKVKPVPGSAFKQMELRIKGSDLIPNWENQGEMGRYSRE
jgi:hypothetical protein